MWGLTWTRFTTRYYEYLPKISNESGDTGPAKFSEIITFQVRPGKESDFRSGIERIHEGTIKTKWAVNYGWYRLVNGGTAGLLRPILCSQELGGL